jgi:hypothetical protein
MARPRIFVSSTYYDLKHVRASLDAFISSLGFEPILFEQGDIAFSPDGPLDESCYREAKGAEILVLIIGGRYGSPASTGESGDQTDPQAKFDSITKKEFKAAVEEDVPAYILVEAGVLAEYQTFKRNRDNQGIKYAHVESSNVFDFIDEIYSMKGNNPVHPFEKAADIETWLRDQWAGLFRELLARRSTQKQVETIAARIGELEAINRTLQTYIEEVVRRVKKDDSEEFILLEQGKLRDAVKREFLRRSSAITRLADALRLAPDVVLDKILTAKSWPNLWDQVEGAINAPLGSARWEMASKFRDDPSARVRREVNDVRASFDLDPLMYE